MRKAAIYVFILAIGLSSKSGTSAQLTSTPQPTTITPTIPPTQTPTTRPPTMPPSTTTAPPPPWDSCQYNTTCPPGFYCSGTYCECRDAVYTRKDPDLRSCQTIVSGSCYEDEECVKDSFCDMFTQQCTCLPGYLPTPTGQCLADFGAVCNVHDKLECNAFAGLQCVEGRCACADSSLGYELGNGCHAQASRICGKVLLSWEWYEGKDKEMYYVECVRGLRCEMGEGQFAERGVCVLETR